VLGGWQMPYPMRKTKYGFSAMPRNSKALRSSWSDKRRGGPPVAEQIQQQQQPQQERNVEPKSGGSDESEAKSPRARKRRSPIYEESDRHSGDAVCLCGGRLRHRKGNAHLLI